MIHDDGTVRKGLGKSISVSLQQVNTVSSLVFQNVFISFELGVKGTMHQIISFIAVTCVIVQRFFPERKVKYDDPNNSCKETIHLLT